MLLMPGVSWVSGSVTCRDRWRRRRDEAEPELLCILQWIGIGQGMEEGVGRLPSNLPAEGREMAHLVNVKSVRISRLYFIFGFPFP